MAIRRIFFQIHLWTGLGLGIYLLMMGVTGSVLVFEDEILASMNPQFYQRRDLAAPQAGIPALVDAVNARHPGSRIYRIYAPTHARGTYLAIVEKDGKFITLFADAATARILGESPRDTFIALMWEAHANLYAGTTGRLVNCVIGFIVLLLPVTGFVLWWPRGGPAMRALWTSPNPRWSRLRGYHALLGLWSGLFLAMFAFTGALYSFGPVFYRVLGVVSPLTQPPYPYSTVPADGARQSAPLPPMLDAARAVAPALPVWGMFPPMSDKSPIRVILGEHGHELGPDHWEWDNRGQQYVYFDQYSGKELARWEMRQRTVADTIRAWVVPLHRGNFGGVGVKVLWTIAGLAPGVLFLLGFVIWRQRLARRGAHSTP